MVALSADDDNDGYLGYSSRQPGFPEGFRRPSASINRFPTMFSPELDSDIGSEYFGRRPPSTFRISPPGFVRRLLFSPEGAAEGYPGDTRSEQESGGGPMTYNRPLEGAFLPHRRVGLPW